MRISYVLYGLALVLTIATGVSHIIEGETFQNIVCPFIAALWVIIAFIHRLTINIQQKTIRLLEKRR